MFTSREVGYLSSETIASVNSRFAVLTEEEILQIRTFLERVVWSPSLYFRIHLFSSLSVNSGF